MQRKHNENLQNYTDDTTSALEVKSNKDTTERSNYGQGRIAKIILKQEKGQD